MRLVADALLPAQFDRIWHQGAARHPGRALAVAVLERAVDDICSHRFSAKRAEQRLYVDARIWMESEDLAWPCSFVNLCLQLGLEPAALRTALLSDAVVPARLPLRRAPRVCLDLPGRN